MEEYFEAVRADLEKMLSDRPCDKCDGATSCTGKCASYEKWFRQIWCELRELYLGPGRGRK